MGKAITTLLKPDILKATAPLQASAGLQGGVEGAIHALRNMFDDTDNEGILLVDADNAFNRLNRKVALHNTSVICPEFSVYLVNTDSTVNLRDCIYLTPMEHLFCHRKAPHREITVPLHSTPAA